MEYNEIIELKNGANFYRCDLHVHTSQSLCYKDKNATAEDIINEAKIKGINLIAITDHNDIGNIEEYIKIGKEKGVYVLPGLEITCNGGRRGIHIIALFDESINRDKIIDLLTQIGITSELRGKEEAITNCTIEDVLKYIKKLNGLTIAAHADSTFGIIDDLEGKTRIKIIKNNDLDCIELNDTSIKNRKYFDGKDKYYKRKIPCVQSSDAHCLSEIGNKKCRLKMDLPSLEGIRQAFIDSDSRIKLEEEVLLSYNKIIGMNIQGGFLDNQVVHLNSNLNCLIGGRGTGKSTFIELLRYTLDNMPNNIEYRDRRLKMIENVLRNGQVTVYIKDKNNELFTIQRRIDTEPVIYDSNGTIIKTKVGELFSIISFGETELEQLSYDSDSQLHIIDNFIRNINDLKNFENTTISELEINRKVIISSEDMLLSLNDNKTELDSVNSKLDILKTHGFEERLKMKTLIEIETNFVNKIIEMLVNIEEVFDKYNIFDDLSDKYKDLLKDIKLSELPNFKKIKEIIKLYKNIEKVFYNYKINDYKKIIKAKDDIEKIYEDIKINYIELEKSTIPLFKEIESEGLTEAANTYIRLKKRKEELKQVPSKLKKENKILRKILPRNYNEKA